MTVIAWATAGAALPGQTSSGDRAVIVGFPNGALVALIDGLGHGKEACEAAVAAERVLLAAPFEETPLLSGHLSVIDRVFAEKAGAAAVRIYENAAWKNRGRSIAMLFASKPIPAPLARRLETAGFVIPPIALKTRPVSRKTRDFVRNQ